MYTIYVWMVDDCRFRLIGEDQPKRLRGPKKSGLSVMCGFVPALSVSGFILSPRISV